MPTMNLLLTLMYFIFDTKDANGWMSVFKFITSMASQAFQNMLVYERNTI